MTDDRLAMAAMAGGAVAPSTRDQEFYAIRMPLLQKKKRQISA